MTNSRLTIAVWGSVLVLGAACGSDSESGGGGGGQEKLSKDEA